MVVADILIVLILSFQYSSYNSSGYSAGSNMASDPRAVDNALRWIADEKVFCYIQLLLRVIKYKNKIYF